MDWQVLAVWLAAGGVVIWIIARWFLRRLGRKDGDDKNGGDNGRSELMRNLSKSSHSRHSRKR